jgi:hypothetical protein
MLQAEIAGRLISPHEGYAERGDVIRDFQLFSAEGQSVLLSEYRGLSSMVLVFAGESDSANNLLSELGTHQPELTGNETRALAIVVGPQERASELRHTLHLGFEVLADDDGGIHECSYAQNCVRICPKDIPLTTSISNIYGQAVKQALLDFFRE